MKKHIWGRFLLVFLVLVFIAILIIYHSSFKIALSKADVKERNVNYIDTGIDDNGHEYRVVFHYTHDNMVKILLLTKDSLGIWHVTDEAVGPDSADTGYVTMGWMRFASIRRYDVNDQARFDSEVHKVYGGNSATKQIEIPLDLLPPNVSANVFQSGTMYVIHFVSYGDADTLDQFYFSDFLDKIDCIQQ